MKNDRPLPPWTLKVADELGATSKDRLKIASIIYAHSPVYELETAVESIARYLHDCNHTGNNYRFEECPEGMCARARAALVSARGH